MRRYLITLAALLVGGLVLVRVGLLDLLAPWLTPPRSWQADRADDNVPPPTAADFAERLARLEVENLMLRRRLHDYEAVAAGSGLQPQRVVLTHARVLARGGRAADRYIEIDAGRQLGVEPGMAVTSGWSLIGIVVSVRGEAAVVRLLTDHGSRVPAHLVVPPDGELPEAPPREAADATSSATATVVALTEADLGVLALGVAAGSGERERLELLYVEDRPNLEISPGQVVVSAGGPGAVPPGLLIGRVASAAQNEASDHWQITVTPAHRGDRLAEVMVLRSPTTGARDLVPER